MRDIEWSVPFRGKLPNGLVRTFSGVYQALDFPEYEWPLKRDERYERAVAACRNTLRSHLSVKMMIPLAAEERGIGCFGWRDHRPSI
ncbi:hypothetical protein QO002_005731 [Pararhizobium capsulatum DSM 1112]|uniref:DUF982 domain-containing protein n=1 Tax=Pararhizobium capsulatum DSM 1112 TaxID=1121113 RepID=A0ABU0C1H6_9HYPH|nr:DUF982 domain-containing protein [Pararhizobium capsulatum]MDQ0323525.1 hypothetical protein [Pararhizobium capsulatum DSM 1112]